MLLTFPLSLIDLTDLLIDALDSCVALPTLFVAEALSAEHGEHKHRLDSSKESAWNLSYAAWFHDEHVKVEQPRTSSGVRL